ncbi:hypothetical protein GCM10009733_061570 [Nonomuraea maheshkhaliensis]|uniref:Uncharacterized protein n=1 Tax=Nonomuraea maheshkhaliensis TaxID=419590 RepID=A0ABP4RLG3_9ACTN
MVMARPFCASGVPLVEAALRPTVSAQPSEGGTGQAVVREAAGGAVLPEHPGHPPPLNYR